jgi:formate-dependent nitrite reductase membrane component NrfD
MWPSVPKIIPRHQLGTAYATIFWVQNIGLTGVPMLIGWVLKRWCRTGIAENPYDYTLPMIIFTCFGLLAVFVARLLGKEDRKKGYGLEKPNIR